MHFFLKTNKIAAKSVKWLTVTENVSQPHKVVFYVDGKVLMER